jgi:hypothetical protein
MELVFPPAQACSCEAPTQDPALTPSTACESIPALRAILGAMTAVLECVERADSIGLRLRLKAPLMRSLALAPRYGMQRIANMSEWEILGLERKNVPRAGVARQ